LKIENLKLKIIKLAALSIFVVVVGYIFSAFLQKPERTLAFDSQKNLTIDDNGFSFIVATSAVTLGDFLNEEKIILSAHDQVIPDRGSVLFPGENIRILRAVKIKITADGKTLENYTLQNSVLGALAENNIVLGRLDKVVPDISTVPADKETITVTRINVEEKNIQEDIPFKTISNTDPKMGWQQQKITQPGVIGSQETKYRITYKNNQEVSRVVLEKNVVTPPTPQIVTQGTFMQLGKANSGQGTWYAYMGGLFAASTSIPRGSYARVTNAATGKSVVVQINDYGPQGKGRVIDLDKVAFQKIAPLGSGVIGVKVEQILN